MIQLLRRAKKGITYMNGLKEKITKKVELSNIFIVLATKSYLKELRELDEEILLSINAAVELKKPFFIVIDIRLTKEEKEEIDRYFRGNNIIKRIETDIKSKRSIEIIAREIKRLSWEMTGKDKDVRIITTYSSEEEDIKD